MFSTVFPLVVIGNKHSDVSQKENGITAGKSIRMDSFIKGLASQTTASLFIKESLIINTKTDQKSSLQKHSTDILFNIAAQDHNVVLSSNRRDGAINSVPAKWLQRVYQAAPTPWGLQPPPQPKLVTVNLKVGNIRKKKKNPPSFKTHR